MSFEYCNEEQIGLPIAGSYALADCLSLHGFNQMRVPVFAYPGTAVRPSYTTYNDTRSGWYSIEIGKWGFSSFGFPVFTFEPGALTFLDLNGRSLVLSLPSLSEDLSVTLPSSSGTLLIEEDFSWKKPVRLATTGNITLSGEQTIDGISATTGMRVLVWAQDDQTENGVYVVSSSSWVRSVDTNSSSRLNGAAVFVQQGDDNTGKIYGQLTVSPDIGVDNILFTEISGSGGGGNYSTTDDYYADSSSTDLDIDITSGRGWLRFLDDQGGYLVLRIYDWCALEGHPDYILESTPLSTQISIIMNGMTNLPNITVGSSAGRNIAYSFEGV